MWVSLHVESSMPINTTPLQYFVIHRFYLGRSACVVPTDPELIKEITVKDFDSFTDRVVSRQ